MSLERHEIIKARECLAELGFEQTPDQIANNPVAVESLGMFKTMLSMKQPMVKRIKKRVAAGADLRRVLESELGRQLTDRQFVIWGHMLRVFCS